MFYLEFKKEKCTETMISNKLSQTCHIGVDIGLINIVINNIDHWCCDNEWLKHET